MGSEGTDIVRWYDKHREACPTCGCRLASLPAEANLYQHFIGDCKQPASPPAPGPPTPDALHRLEAEDTRKLTRIALLTHQLRVIRGLVHELWGKATPLDGPNDFVVTYDVPAGILHRLYGEVVGQESGRPAAPPAPEPRPQPRLHKSWCTLDLDHDGKCEESQVSIAPVPPAEAPRLAELKREKFTPEGKAERVQRSLDALNQPSPPMDLSDLDECEYDEESSAVPAAGPDSDDDLTHYMKATSRMRERAESAESRLSALQEEVAKYRQRAEFQEAVARATRKRLSALAEKAQDLIDSAVTHADCCPICGCDIQKHDESCTVAALRLTLEEIKKNVATGEGKG